MAFQFLELDSFPLVVFTFSSNIQGFFLRHATTSFDAWVAPFPKCRQSVPPFRRRYALLRVLKECGVLDLRSFPPNVRGFHVGSARRPRWSNVPHFLFAEFFSIQYGYLGDRWECFTVLRSAHSLLTVMSPLRSLSYPCVVFSFLSLSIYSSSSEEYATSFSTFPTDVPIHPRGFSWEIVSSYEVDRSAG